MTNETEQKIKEKKVKNIERLEKVLIGTGLLGVGSIMAGTIVDNEILGAYLAWSGILVGSVSGIAGYHISSNLQFLEESLEDYKKNKEYQIEVENKYKEGLEDNQRWTIK